MNNIPVLSVTDESLALTYEAALVKLYKEGTRFKTQYDKPGDPLSLDCTLNATVLNPELDPMIHQAFPGGIDELKEYVMELKERSYHGRTRRTRRRRSGVDHSLQAVFEVNHVEVDQ